MTSRANGRNAKAQVTGGIKTRDIIQLISTHLSHHTPLCQAFTLESNSNHMFCCQCAKD